MQRTYFKTLTLTLSMLTLATQGCDKGDDGDDSGGSSGSASADDTGTGEEGGSASGTTAGTTASTSASGSSSSSSSGGETSSGEETGGETGGAEDDPVFPRPEGGMCPDGFAQVMGVNACLPPCMTGGPSMPTCSNSVPETGTASAQCVFNPDSNPVTCMTTEDCPQAAMGETCQMNAGGTMTCLLPPSHCLLLCSVSMMNCPDAMTCAPLQGDTGACTYPP